MRNILLRFRERGARYLFARTWILIHRYGIRKRKAQERIKACVELVSRYGSLPTFAIPGRVVEENRDFAVGLTEQGVELAVHGYNHVDFRGLSDEAVATEFARAAQAFESNGVKFAGFRCPYLSYEESMARHIRDERYGYSSNHGIFWRFSALDGDSELSSRADELLEIYRADQAVRVVSRPRFVDALVEIPAALPGDLELLDDYGFTDRDVSEFWARIFRETHRDSELFAPLLHPEAFYDCRGAIERLLSDAQGLEHPVWIAQLREIASWWRRRSRFTAAIRQRSGKRFVRFSTEPDGTVLVRDPEVPAPGTPWFDRYEVLDSTELLLTDGTTPFLGLAEEIPEWIRSFLREEGFITVQVAESESCAVVLQAEEVESLESERDLLEYVEGTEGHLVRFSRWPNGARSAISIASDLDALSLSDYARRFFVF